MSHHYLEYEECSTCKNHECYIPKLTEYNSKELRDALKKVLKLEKRARVKNNIKKILNKKREIKRLTQRLKKLKRSK